MTFKGHPNRFKLVQILDFQISNNIFPDLKTTATRMQEKWVTDALTQCLA